MMMGFGVLLVVVLIVVVLIAGIGALLVWLNSNRQRGNLFHVEPRPETRDQTVVPEADGNHFCSHCGAGLQTGWTYCPQCGAPAGPR